ncbi:uncharacterized protein LOC142223946 [Haematobia irritans]|uniref:uncharacterized protein LOC142223946 n=1 Tax=Haematobia irritans TaxID=7368 RepID=UPI003F5000AD
MKSLSLFITLLTITIAACDGNENYGYQAPSYGSQSSTAYGKPASNTYGASSTSSSYGNAAAAAAPSYSAPAPSSTYGSPATSTSYGTASSSYGAPNAASSYGSSAASAAVVAPAPTSKYAPVAIAAPPCPKNYLFSCVPQLRPLPCAPHQGTYAQNAPVYTAPQQQDNGKAGY